VEELDEMHQDLALVEHQELVKEQLFQVEQDHVVEVVEEALHHDQQELKQEANSLVDLILNLVEVKVHVLNLENLVQYHVQQVLVLVFVPLEVEVYWHQ